MGLCGCVCVCVCVGSREQHRISFFAAGSISNPGKGRVGQNRAESSFSQPGALRSSQLRGADPDSYVMGDIGPAHLCVLVGGYVVCLRSASMSSNSRGGCLRRTAGPSGRRCVFKALYSRGTNLRFIRAGLKKTLRVLPFKPTICACCRSYSVVNSCGFTNALG